jgi:hypothetical protein
MPAVVAAEGVVAAEALSPVVEEGSFIPEHFARLGVE